MASVERQKRAKGAVYVVRYRDPDRRQRTATFGRKSDADRFARGVETDIDRGNWHDAALGRTLLLEWAERWFSETVQPTKKAGTVARYRSLLDKHVLPAFGASRVAAIRPSAVQSWVAEMESAGLAPATIRTAYVVLSQILKKALSDGAITRNPAVGTALPRAVRREASFFDPATVEALAEAAPDPYGLVIRILGTTGLRWAELVALRRRHVDLLRRRLTVELNAPTINGRLEEGTPKAGRSRVVPLTRPLAAALHAHLGARPAGPDTYLFVNSQGRPLRYQRFVESIWRPALGEVGLPTVGIHVLRHSAAAALDAAGASPKAIQTILGHATAGYTLTVYGHVFDESLDGIGDRLEELMARSVTPVEQATVTELPRQT